MSSLNSLASAITKAEGKKHQASIGDVREILKIMVSFEASYITNLGKLGGSPCIAISAAAMALITNVKPKKKVKRVAKKKTVKKKVAKRRP